VDETREALEERGMGWIEADDFEGVPCLAMGLRDLTYNLGRATVGRGQTANNVEDVHDGF
jgi:hypothetical protein